MSQTSDIPVKKKSFLDALLRRKTNEELVQKDEAFYRAGQWQLVWWKFRRHKLAQLAMWVLGILYFIALFAEPVSPYDPLHRMKEYTGMPPTPIRIVDYNGHLRLPFVYKPLQTRDPETLRPIYKEDPTGIYPVKLFVPGDEYKILGLIPGNIHLYGTGVKVDGKVIPVFILGADLLGRDVLTRIFFAGRISLTVGLLGIFLSFIFGLILGGVTGYFGGLVDEVIMRLIDVLISLPQIPLWMSLAAALPQDWPPLQTYFFVTIILSIFGWTSLARTIRGKLLSLREEDYVMAAKLDGEKEWNIISRYMLPGFASYIIVSLTISIPGMILGETSLSFLGLGLQPPVISYGVMLQDAQNLKTVSQLPWLLWPCAFVVLAVLMFNFLGDGLRDAADPYVT